MSGEPKEKQKAPAAAASKKRKTTTSTATASTSDHPKKKTKAAKGAAAATTAIASAPPRRQRPPRAKKSKNDASVAAGAGAGAQMDEHEENIVFGKEEEDDVMWGDGGGGGGGDASRNLQHGEPVILHLRCFLRDLTEQDMQIQKLIPSAAVRSYTPTIPPDIMAYDKKEDNYFSYIDSSQQQQQPTTTTTTTTDVTTTKQSQSLAAAAAGAQPPPPSKKEDFMAFSSSDAMTDTATTATATTTTAAECCDRDALLQKLKRLKLSLYKNTQTDKPSACFWCTYPFNTPVCVIPKYELEHNAIQVYGAFCTPECAAAFLMREEIDDSVKFERYQLLNQMYRYNTKTTTGIALAPSPYYVVEKFYGTLTPEEYRALSRMQKTLVVLDRPMTRQLPELHEERDDFASLQSSYTLGVAGLGVGGGGGSGAASMTSVGLGMTFNGIGNYRVKRQDDVKTKPCKNALLREKFGVA